MRLVKVSLGALYGRRCQVRTDEYNVYLSVLGTNEYILK
jgi:hypothetical protein